jgi:hypothetical protein
MRRRKSAGNVVVLGCVLFSAVFAFFLLVLDIGRFHAARARAQTLAQASTLGSLRMRIEALQKIADRWSTFGAKLGAVDAAGRVFVNSADAASVDAAAHDLSRALSGYQARTQSIITVLAQSNNIPRDRITTRDDAGARLDVAPQPATIIDPSGSLRVIAALWYRRGWSASDDDGDPAGTESQRVAFAVGPLTTPADAWRASTSTQGQLRWNSSVDGNGGYPRNWGRALVAGRVNPNRTASYRAVLTESAP